MDFQTIIYDIREHIAKITINRPERMNGYSEPMVKDLIAAIDLARQDDEVRVLIITGKLRAGAFRSESDFLQLALEPFNDRKRAGANPAIVKVAALEHIDMAVERHSPQ